MASGAYPHFESGNVLIIAPNRRTWKLDATTLARASGVFEKLLTKQFQTKLSKRQKHDSKTVGWHVKLAADPQNGGLATLSHFKPNEKRDLLVFLTNSSDPGSDLDYVTVYDNFFRCLYNEELLITEGTIRQLVQDALNLLRVAESLEAAPTVRRVIESLFLRRNQLLWQHVRQQPEGWADIAIRLQSPVIYREAMLHLVGQWKFPNRVKKATLRGAANGKLIFDLVCAKVEAIDEIKRGIERQLVEFFPDFMRRPMVGTNCSIRQDYAGDIYLWQAMSVMRQFIGNAILSQLHHQADDGGAAFYRVINKGTTSYITQSELDIFHESFSMTKKGRECLTDALFMIKELLRPIVAPLLVDNAQTVVGMPEFDYLTSATFEDKELPWYRDVAEETPKDMLQLELEETSRVNPISYVSILNEADIYIESETESESEFEDEENHNGMFVEQESDLDMDEFEPQRQPQRRNQRQSSSQPRHPTRRQPRQQSESQAQYYSQLQLRQGYNPPPAGYHGKTRSYSPIDPDQSDLILQVVAEQEAEKAAAAALARQQMEEAGDRDDLGNNREDMG